MLKCGVLVEDVIMVVMVIQVVAVGIVVEALVLTAAQLMH
jgi:hypothetical protein